MANNPLVSVIIPVFNGEKYIVEAIESVLEQSYRNIEIIVIDDGSTDDSAANLHPYLDKIRYIYQKNGGIASAYNSGAEACKGEYVAFIEQDDVWLPEKLSMQVAYLVEKPNLDMVFCRYFIVDDRVATKRPELSKCWPGEVSFQELFLNTLENASIITFSSVLMRKSLLRAIMPFDERLRVSVDYDTWLKVAYESKIGFLDKPLLKYRLHDFNTSSAPITALEDDLIVLQKWQNNKRLLGIIGKGRVVDRLWSLYNGLRFYYMQSNSVSDERRCLMRMIRLKPFSLDLIWRLLLTFISQNSRRKTEWYLVKLKKLFLSQG